VRRRGRRHPLVADAGLLRSRTGGPYLRDGDRDRSGAHLCRGELRAAGDEGAAAAGAVRALARVHAAAAVSVSPSRRVHARSGVTSDPSARHSGR
jgi:hypothetical protein